jgi:hypothetical protein
MPTANPAMPPMSAWATRRVSSAARVVRTGACDRLR